MLLQIPCHTYDVIFSFKKEGIKIREAMCFKVNEGESFIIYTLELIGDVLKVMSGHNLRFI